MTKKQLRKLRLELESFRAQGGIRSRELKQFAARLGRREFTGRGKHPMWITDLPGRSAVPIPDHPGDMSRSTAKSILNELENDLEALEDTCSDDDQEE